MQLKYRGTTYDYNPPATETTETNVGGKYRGLDWRFHNRKKQPILQPATNLTYRGVTYNTGESANQVQSGVSTQDKARMLQMNRDRANRKRQQTMLKRSALEVGLA